MGKYPYSKTVRKPPVRNSKKTVESLMSINNIMGLDGETILYLLRKLF